MGQRHNRKRTRSRPRHRSHTQQNHSRTSSVSSSKDRNIEPAPPLPHYQSSPFFEELYSAWQMQDDEDAMEAQRLRLFGGETGDEVSLCEPMLKVVMDLFNDIDYIDP
ncbi:hypothetical protein EJ05DRAFT_511776, partial [Pseudovirgaria hyperparasitica]